MKRHRASVLGVDVETLPITPSNPCPTVVCLAAASETGKVVLKERRRAKRLLRRLLDEAERSGARVGGSRIAYDVVATMRMDKETIPRWFKLMARGGLYDVLLREKLDLLATVGDPDAGKGGAQNLADLVRKHLGVEIRESKEDPQSWRTRFHELDGLPAEKYPAAARRYVMKDALYPIRIAQVQKNRKPESIHTNASVCYFLKTVQGLRVDRKAKRKLERLVHGSLGEKNLPLIYKHGLIKRSVPERDGRNKEHVPACPRKDCDCPKKKLKPQKEKLAKSEVLLPLIQQICLEHDLVVKRLPATPAAIKKAMEKFGWTEEEAKAQVQGNICTDADYIAHLAAFSPILRQYETHLEFVKLRDSYFPSHEWPFGSGKTVRRVFCGYNDLVKTGRGSSRGVSKKNRDTALYPSVAIQLSDPRMRWVYRPTKGHVYAVADYSAIDLNCLAQTIKDLYGSSTLLNQINAGINPHDFLACALAFDIEPKFAKLVKGRTDEEGYKVFKSLKNDQGWLREPKKNRHGVTWADFYKEVRDLAKKVGLGYAGGMGLETMIGLCRKELRSKHRPDGYVITKAEAKRFREIWFRIYPEMRWYLRKWVPSQKDHTGEWLQYKSPSGMKRVRCSYTECANGRALQTPAAEGMKIADFLVTRACYDPTGLDGKGPDILFGCRPVINMHDELVLEIPISTPRLMDRQARRLGELMVLGMKQILPDVAVVAEPYLTTRWVKVAKATHRCLKCAGVFTDPKEHTGCKGKLLLTPWRPQKKDYPWNQEKETAA